MPKIKSMPVAAVTSILAAAAVVGALVLAAPASAAVTSDDTTPGCAANGHVVLDGSFTNGSGTSVQAEMSWPDGSKVSGPVTVADGATQTFTIDTGMTAIGNTRAIILWGVQTGDVFTNNDLFLVDATDCAPTALPGTVTATPTNTATATSTASSSTSAVVTDPSCAFTDCTTSPTVTGDCAQGYVAVDNRCEQVTGDCAQGAVAVGNRCERVIVDCAHGYVAVGIRCERVLGDTGVRFSVPLTVLTGVALIILGGFVLTLSRQRRVAKHSA